MGKKYTHCRFFDLKEIIFDNSESVTLIGKAYFNDERKFINLLTDFKKLDKILKIEHKYGGKEIAEAIGNQLVNLSENSPQELEICDILNEEFVISDYIVISSGDIMPENENSEDTDLSSIYSLEEIIEFGYWNINDQVFPEIVYEELDTLNQFYQLYLELLKAGFSDKIARQTFGLENDLVFTLAEKLYKTIKHDSN
jgi:hypothetical protein